MITIDKIRKNLKDAIKYSGKTQNEIAKELGIRQSSVAQYVSGRAMPALETFAKLCKILDVDPNDILY